MKEHENNGDLPRDASQFTMEQIATYMFMKNNRNEEQVMREKQIELNRRQFSKRLYELGKINEGLNGEMGEEGEYFMQTDYSISE